MIDYSEFINAADGERREIVANALKEYVTEHPTIADRSGCIRDYLACFVYTNDEYLLYNCPELRRFINAHQDKERGFDVALNEVKNGFKKTHWIWYILPQLRGLGHSKMSEYYGLRDRYEADAYLSHSLLRQHLIDMANAIINNSATVYDIFGKDTIKVRSCFLLFNSIESIPEIQKVISMYNWH